MEFCNYTHSKAIYRSNLTLYRHKTSAKLCKTQADKSLSATKNHSQYPLEAIRKYLIKYNLMHTLQGNDLQVYSPAYEEQLE